jgi:hypothetical protein
MSVMREKQTILPHEKAMTMLNNLGNIYHTYFGFNNHSEHYVPNTEEDKQLFWSDYASHEEQDGEEIWYDLDLSCVESAGNEMTPYSVVKLKLPEGYWTSYNASNEWYNKPSAWWKDLKEPLQHLPYLKSRGFITIARVGYEIVVSAAEKGIPLTIEDILFAARGLAMDDTRTVATDGFNILSYEDGVLVLEPKTDNWST